MEKYFSECYLECDSYYTCKNCSGMFTDLYAKIHKCEGSTQDKMKKIEANTFQTNYLDAKYNLGNSSKNAECESIFKKLKDDLQNALKIELLSNSKAIS